MHTHAWLQVGSFPNWDVWSEWNGKYRDDLRRFMKGDAGVFACVLGEGGSPQGQALSGLITARLVAGIHSALEDHC